MSGTAGWIGSPGIPGIGLQEVPRGPEVTGSLTSVHSWCAGLGREEEKGWGGVGWREAGEG